MDNRKQLIRSILPLVVLLAAPKASVALIEAGGLHFLKAPAVAVERQDVSISLDKIKVSYVFTNTSALDLIQTVVFPIPYQEQTQQKQFKEERLNQFTVTVNGRLVEHKLLERPISFTGQDISPILKSFNLPSNPIEALHRLDTSQNMHNIRKRLVAMDLLDPKHDTPKWFSKGFYHWQQLFPPAEEVHIFQAYKPSIRIHKGTIERKQSLLQKPKRTLQNIFDKIRRKDPNDRLAEEIQTLEAVASFQSDLDRYAAHIKQFCPSMADYQKLMANYQQPNQKTKLVTREVRYNFMHDDNWSGPIRRFTLKIEHPANMQPILCWPTPFERHSPTTIVFEAENYLPLQDIALLLIE